MRRIFGAWLLFCLVALPQLTHDAVRLFVSTRAAVDDRQDVPGANDLPGEKTPPVSQELPPRFLEEPLVFFSTAPPESLALLPGIGPVLAARIRDARGGKRFFKTWNDLRRVKGIGEKTVSRFKRLADLE
jgi:predicted flap endonuclease-1-like 5' DNA nuclease